MIPGRGVRMVRRRRVVGTAMGVAATASMVSNARRNRAERKAIEQQTDAQNASMDYQQPVETAEPQDSELKMQLEELNELKNKGILTQEEFEAKKKQLLNL